MTTDTEPIEATAVVVSDQPMQQAVTLFQTDDPVQVIDKATAIASALANVIRKQGLASNIQGKEYVRCEGWTLLGSMLGVFPVNVWTRELPEGRGWEARVEARRGEQVVGAAEAMCSRDEQRWARGKADEYAVRSMAQTRATAKALRIPLGFVMQLAGYEVTPHEEMDTVRPSRAAATSGNGDGALTAKQANFISGLLRQIYDGQGAQAQGFIDNLRVSYPHADVGGKFIVKQLKFREAQEVIDILKDAIGKTNDTS